MSDLIDRQQAIDALVDMHCKSDEDGYVWIIRSDAWARIDALPSAQPEYRLDEWCTDCKEYNTEKHCCPRFNQVIRTTLNEMKSERKKGKWIPDNRPGGGFWVCSCCKFPSEAFAADKLYKYCPNCGAKMI